MNPGLAREFLTAYAILALLAVQAPASLLVGTARALDAASNAPSMSSQTRKNMKETKNATIITVIANMLRRKKKNNWRKNSKKSNPTLNSTTKGIKLPFNGIFI